MSDTILEVDGLTKSYSGADGPVRAVDGVNFEVERGEIVGLLGPNGAGKTTTIKCILGLITPSGGSIRIDGVNPVTDPKKTYERASAILEGARNVYWRLTVRENLRFFVGVQGVHPDAVTEKYERLISKLDLEDKADDEVRNLSRGMQQKVSLACSMVQGTDLLFLDEPTLGLDVEASVDLRREIRRLADTENRTIVLSSHNMKVVQELCDRVIILNGGQVVVNDDVDNLTNVFRSQTYEIAFQPGTEPSQQLDEYSCKTVEGTDVPTVEAVVSGSQELYELMETFREADAEIARIESVEPDLEDVFLSEIGDADAEAQPVGGQL